MKASVNFEFGSEEIERFVAGAVTRGIWRALDGIGPNEMQVMLAGLHTGMGIVMSHAQQAMLGRPHTHGPPPPWARGPFGPPPGQPYGATGPIPSTGQGPYATPDNVRPIRESAVTEHCFRIEATRHLEEGWGCCGCSTYNGLQRTTCRHCGHTRCGALITPAPVGGPAPRVAPAPVPDGMTYVAGVGLVPTAAIIREMKLETESVPPATQEPEP
jgi:hypothetical protein